MVKLPHVLGTPQAISDDTLNFSSLASDLQQLLPSNDPAQAKLCDVLFIVDGKSLHAHKAILAARSSYFRALFLNGMQESNNGVDEIQVNDFSYDVFRCVLHWVYTDTLSLPAEILDTQPDLVHSNAFSVWTLCTYVLGRLGACTVFGVNS